MTPEQEAELAEVEDHIASCLGLAMECRCGALSYDWQGWSGRAADSRTSASDFEAAAEAWRDVLSRLREPVADWEACAREHWLKAESALSHLAVETQ